MIWSAEADTDPAMWGRATLAMVVSSAVMMVASMIEMVIMPRLATAGPAVAMLAKVSAAISFVSLRRAFHPRRGDARH